MDMRIGTKVLRRALCFGIPVVMAVASSGFAQATWSKLEGNPVITPGASGQWDDHAVKTGDVIFDGSTYHMWYTGERDFTASDIGYATSPDGVEWTKHPANPVLTRGEAGAWDDFLVYCPTVVWDGSVFHMWYTGGREASWVNSRIGYATSPDGVVWTKHPDNPVMRGGGVGSWDETAVVAGTVIADDAGFTMWYTGWGLQTAGSWIGRASSRDGVTWSRLADAVMVDIAGYDNLWAPEVTFDGSAYHMWVSADFMGTWNVFYAASSDGRDWVMDEGRPILEIGPAGSWDAYRLVAPRVVIGDSTAQLWYSGLAEATSASVGYATAVTSEFEPALVHCSWLEIASHEAGSAGSDWRTDVVAQNTSQDAAVVLLTLHTEDGDVTLDATIEGRGQAVFEDVVGLLGYTGKGSIELLSDRPLRVVSRIYNLADTGTFGQLCDASAKARALAAGESAWLVGLRQAEGAYRTNISITNIDTMPSFVNVSLYDTSGQELATYSLMVMGGRVEHDLQPFSVRANQPNLGWGYAEVTVSFGGRILASASVVDSMTNDATTIPMKR